MSMLSKVGLASKQKILGVPVGREQPDWGKLAWTGAGAMAAVAGPKAVKKAAKAASLNGLMKKGEGVLDKPGELAGKGSDALESVTDVGDTVSDLKEAVGGESSTLGKLKAGMQALGGGGDGEEGDEKKARLIIQEQIDIAAPRDYVYEQWKDFDEFDSIFRAVQQVQIEDDDEDSDEDSDEDDGEKENPTTSWQAKILLSSRQWESEITNDVPEQRIAWQSSGDVDHVGAVTFHEVSDSLTRLHLEMEYHPTGVVEKFGNLFLTVRHRVRKDLRLFKHHIELDGSPWEDDDERERDEKGRFKKQS